MKKTCIAVAMLFLSLVSGIGCNYLLTHAYSDEESGSAYVMKVESNIETSMVFATLDE